MTWVYDANGELYDDGSSASIYGGTGDNLVPTGDAIEPYITYGSSATDLVNPNNDFTYNPDAPQTYGDASSWDQYINSPDLTPTSSANITANMSPSDIQAIAKIMQGQSNANTATGGGPGPTTDYISALMAGLKAKTLDLASLSPALQKAITGTTPAAPSFLDSIGNFLKTSTGQAVGIGGIAALLQAMGNKGTGEIYKGYQGGIPNLSATRTMNAIPTTRTDASGNTVARRPGQGGITYFSPMRYAPAAAATSDTAPSPAAGIVAASSAYSAPTLEFSTPNVPNQEPIAKAAGGLSSLGGYSDGGRLLRGPGDGISDSIPATIGQKQPARLADGEFVVPARVVSEIGNGSTEAGARKLYAMMDRVQKARGKTLKNVAANSKADKYLPA